MLLLFAIVQHGSTDFVDGFIDAFVGRLKLLERMENASFSPRLWWHIRRELLPRERIRFRANAALHVESLAAIGREEPSCRRGRVSRKLAPQGWESA